MVVREYGRYRLEFDGHEYAAVDRETILLRGPRLAPIERRLAEAWMATLEVRLGTLDLFA